jgi:hypothetical protein
MLLLSASALRLAAARRRARGGRALVSRGNPGAARRTRSCQWTFTTSAISRLGVYYYATTAAQDCQSEPPRRPPAGPSDGPRARSRWPGGGAPRCHHPAAVPPWQRGRPRRGHRDPAAGLPPRPA